MGSALATARVRLIHRASGAVVEAWPVDAREMVAAGDHVNEADYVAPTVDAPVVPTSSRKR